MSKADFDALMGALADDPDLMGSVLGRSYSIWENTHMVFAMIVADKFNLTENETSIKEELEKKYHVFVVDDDDVDAGNFNFEVCNGVLVSTSVTDMTKINKLTTLPVICITRNPEVALTIFRMGSDAGGEDTSWGTTADQTQINIIDNSHQILLDEALGANTVYTEPGRLQWVRTADLVADVYRLAEIVGDATKTVIAVLPFEGTDQDGNLAPQNRIFFGLREYHVYNGDALEHFYAMIDWLGHEMALITKIEALEKSKIIQDMLGRGNFVKTRNAYDYVVTGTTGSPPFEAISEQESRSVMERLEWIKNGIRRGTGTILPLNTSLYDYLLAIEGKLDVPANFMADVSALALEATLNTHDTDIKALLATIAGYIDTEIIAIETKLDSPANFMADVSSLAPANEYDAEMARITANVATEAKQDIIDTVVDAIKVQTDKLPRVVSHMDFWSDNLHEIALTTTPLNYNLPNVAVTGLPTDITIIRVVALLKIALIKDTSGADNAINTILMILKVDASSDYSSPLLAIHIPDNSWAVDVSEATERGGDAMVGTYNIEAEVIENATYYGRFEHAACDGNNLLLKDVAWGLRVYFTV